MNVNPIISNDILPYSPLPLDYEHLINVGLAQNFKPEAILTEHEFTGSNRTGRIKVNMAAFTDRIHHDLDTAAVTVYYNPDGSVADQLIIDQLAFTGAPFVLIGRNDLITPVGIKVNGRVEAIQLATSYPYNQIGEFFERYRADLNPERIAAVKKGTAVFDTFAQLNSFQLRLFALDVTRRQLAQLFGESVAILRSHIKSEDLVVDYAVQLLCAIILAHKGRLGVNFTKPDSDIGSLLMAAENKFPSYFDRGIGSQVSLPIQNAYLRLQQVTYSSFTPDMLSELYISAYPDKEKRKQEGRFDTPLYLTRMILNNLPIETIRPDQRLLLDMTCGWGSFLVAGYERFSQISDMERMSLSRHIIGNDRDKFTAQLARVALLTTSLTDAWQVENQDALELNIQGRQPTLIVGNPPFRGARKEGSQATQKDHTTGKSKRLQEADNFLLKAIQLLEPGGYLGMLMPQSFSVGEASTSSRRALLEGCDILEFWDLPMDIFKHQARVSPMVIFAKKRLQKGEPLNFPVRARSAQKRFLESHGVFSASNISVSQADWGQTSRKARSKSASVTHIISYTTILSEPEWDKIRARCITVDDIADITPGAIVGTKRRWIDYPNPKRVPWLSNAKKALPRPFLVRYGTETVVYPNALEEPRKNKQNPQKDKEHLLFSPKVLLTTLTNPRWGQRVKVAIERKGVCVSDGFYVFVPKPFTISLEVLAALLSWDVSNALIVESLRYPRIQHRVLSAIPIPPLSSSECKLIEDAVHIIEASAKNNTFDLEAHQRIDEALKRAYQLDDRTFEMLRLVKEWDSKPKQFKHPAIEPVRETLPIQGIIESVDGLSQTINVVFTGIQGEYTLPITDNMPGWMLRPGVAFQADVTYRALMDEDWDNLRWWNIRPQELTYLSEEELIQNITDELARN